MSKKVRVLVVDDSAIVRRIVSDTLSKDPEIEVVDTAVDPYIAREKIARLKPDVLTLDIEMPRMDGLTFLRLIMKHHPMPVIIMSSLTQSGSQKALEAMEAGAVAVLGKSNGSYSVGELSQQLAGTVKEAALAKVQSSSLSSHSHQGKDPQRQSQVSEVIETERPKRPADLLSPPKLSGNELIVMGASTGGTEALRNVLEKLPPTMPPIFIVQHIPAMFSKSFAERLDSLCEINVSEAIDGKLVSPGEAVVAPGGYHMLIRRMSGGYRAALKEGPMVWHQRPAVDVLFKSASSVAPNTLAVILTGMGRDGADSMLQLRNKGARTIAQDEKSCVVFGMPRAAMENGAAEQMVPLEKISRVMEKSISKIVSHDSANRVKAA